MTKQGRWRVTELLLLPTLLVGYSAVLVQSSRTSFSACKTSVRISPVLRLRGAGSEKEDGAAKDEDVRNPDMVGIMSSQGLLVRPSAFADDGSGAQTEARSTDRERKDGEERMCDEENDGMHTDEESEDVEEISEGQLLKNENLWEAVKEGDDVAVQAAVRDGADLECGDPAFGGWTAMHYAAQSGRARIVTCLLRLGASVDSQNDRGSTPLSLAAAEGHISIVQKLVARGAAVDAANAWGITPLHRAASAGCSKTCEKLIALGANLNATNLVGVNALHRSVASGHLDTAETLLATGADVHAPNNDGWTALHYAAQNGDLEMVEVLLDAGAKTMALTRLMELPAHKAERAGHGKAADLLVKKAWAEEWGPTHMDVPKRDPQELQEEYDELWRGTWEEERAPAAEEESKAQQRAEQEDGLVFWQEGKAGVAESDQELSDEAAESEGGSEASTSPEEEVLRALEEVTPEESEALKAMFERIRLQIRQRMAAYESGPRGEAPSEGGGGDAPAGPGIGHPLIDAILRPEEA